MRVEYTKNGIGCQLKKTTRKLDLAQTRRKHQLRVEMLHGWIIFKNHDFRKKSWFRLAGHTYYKGQYE